MDIMKLSTVTTYGDLKLSLILLLTLACAVEAAPAIMPIRYINITEQPLFYLIQLSSDGSSRKAFSLSMSSALM